MELQFTLKIKGSGKKNPPEFKKGLGAGVLEIRVLDFIGAKKKDLKSPMFHRQLHETIEGIISEWIEVKVEILTKKNKKNEKTHKLPKH